MTFCPECTCLIAKTPDGKEVLGALCDECRRKILKEALPAATRKLTEMRAHAN